MDEVAKRYPVGEVYIVWDNLNIHHGPRWEEFNRRHGGRFHFVYTPLHASWVNQIEIWFSIVRRRILKHASFRTVHLWTLEIATHSGRWEKTGIRGQWRELLKELITSFSWTLAPIE